MGAHGRGVPPCNEAIGDDCINQKRSQPRLTVCTASILVSVHHSDYKACWPAIRGLWAENDEHVNCTTCWIFIVLVIYRYAKHFAACCTYAICRLCAMIIAEHTNPKAVCVCHIHAAALCATCTHTKHATSNPWTACS